MFKFYFHGFFKEPFFDPVRVIFLHAEKCPLKEVEYVNVKSVCLQATAQVEGEGRKGGRQCE